jgi:NAD(P)-dependent dehydrogenase (short-subunit alcohol dehydrogenase family)
MVSYATAKAGLIQFSKSVARQYAAAGIRANTIVPGLMNTPLVMDRIADQYGAGDIDETIAMRDAMCPTGKMGTAWDVGWAAVFLASDEARYVTGTEIVVDGGLTA